MSVRFHPDASTEVDAAVLWYEQEQVGLGAAFLDELSLATVAITEAPRAWPVISKRRQLRRFLLTRFPFGPNRVSVVPRANSDSSTMIAPAHRDSQTYPRVHPTMATTPSKSDPIPPKALKRRSSNPLLEEMRLHALRSRVPLNSFIFRVRDFGIGCLAMGQKVEAAEVFEFAALQATPRSGPAAWFAAASSMAMATYVHRMRPGRIGRPPSLGPYLSSPAHAIFIQTDVWTPTFVRKHLKGESARFGATFSDERVGAAAEARAWWIASTVFFREVADLGFPARASASYIGRLESLRDSSLAEFRAWLAERA